jgi:hypothetical protein
MKNLLLTSAAMFALALSPAFSDTPQKHHQHQDNGGGGAPPAAPSAAPGAPAPEPSNPVMSTHVENGLTKIRGSNKTIEFDQNKTFNDKTVVILGNHDTIIVDQMGLANTARIVTTGNGDTADINQIGVANYASTHQGGSKMDPHNVTNIRQVGMKNTIRVEQGNTIAMFQINSAFPNNLHCTAVAVRIHCASSSR